MSAVDGLVGRALGGVTCAMTVGGATAGEAMAGGTMAGGMA